MGQNCIFDNGKLCAHSCSQNGSFQPKTIPLTQKIPSYGTSLPNYLTRVTRAKAAHPAQNNLGCLQIQPCQRTSKKFQRRYNTRYSPSFSSKHFRDEEFAGFPFRYRDPWIWMKKKKNRNQYNGSLALIYYPLKKMRSEIELNVILRNRAHNWRVVEKWSHPWSSVPTHAALNFLCQLYKLFAYIALLFSRMYKLHGNCSMVEVFVRHAANLRHSSQD